MLASLILGSVALMSGLFAGVLLVIVLGIRRGDRGKRLTGRPGSNSEALARRLLTSSRGYHTSGDMGEDR
jgi:Flp pilus assembly protein protease CpaA